MAMKGGTRMLNNVQYGGAPSVYAYSGNTANATDNAFHVFASCMNGYDSRREKNGLKVEDSAVRKTVRKSELEDSEDSQDTKEEAIQEYYHMGYGKRESFLWKQR